MTIIQPTRRRAKLWPLVSLLASIFIGSVVIGVFLYNATVNLRHRAASLEENLAELHLRNAELEDKMYSLLQVQHLTAVAHDLGLVMERHPRYLDTTADILVQRSL